MFVLLGGAVFLTYHVLQNKVRFWGNLNEQCFSDILLWATQSFGSIKESKILGRELFFRKQFSRPVFVRAHLRALVSTSGQAPRAIIELVAIISIFLVAFIILARDGAMGNVVTVIGLFSIVAMRLIPSATRIAAFSLQLQEGSASVDIVHKEVGHVMNLRRTPSPKSSLPFDRKIGLENLSYRYPGASEPVLRNIELTIDRGQSVAFIGSSGAGKTTIVDVILGLLDPVEGRLTIDGVDARKNVRAWQDCIGYVPQTIYLLDNTLRRNIAFGIADAQIDEERVLEVVRMARLEEMVSKLPEGLDTFIGEGGVRLSGGQRQRAGIARALYHDPYVLILDEATAALDNETERDITQSIDALHGEKTVILIAHRLSTVRRCDRIFFLKDGQLIDFGTFEELNGRNTDFQRLVRLGSLQENARHDA